MTVTATYDNTLSRVRLAISAAPASADYAVVDRSTNGVVWTRVRGGDQVALNSGAGQLDDYEFPANVLTTYRVRYVDSAPASLMLAAGGAQAVNASVNPVLPASPQPGDTLILIAAIRNSGVGTVDLPAGWTALGGLGTNFLVAAREWGLSGFAAPTVTFTGGVANADTQAFIVGARNTKLPAVSAVAQLNGSAQDVDSPAFATVAGGFMARAGWKQDDGTPGVVPGPALTLMGLLSSTAGDDASLWIAGAIAASSGAEPARTTPMVGGAAAISRAVSFSIPLADFVHEETQTITPSLDRVWIKNVQRPYLNTPVVVTDFSEVTRKSRSGVFPVVGRSYPVAVTELHGSREQMLTITVPTLAEADDLDLRLHTGEPIFVHSPGADCPIATMYAVIGDTAQRRNSKRTTRRYFDLPLTEVAAPSGVIVGITVTYNDVLTAFATYADLLAAEPTYSDVLDRIADPTDVIVP
jgi:hypothetical protein